MRFLLHLTVLVVLACSALPAIAQPSAVTSAPPPTVDSSKLADAARLQMADIRKQLAGNDLDDAKLNQFRDAAAAIDAQADALVADRAPRLAAVEASLSQLGPAPAKGATEATDIAAQRTALGKQRATLDTETKRAKLLSVDSLQLASDIAEVRRTRFQARLSQRTSSPLTGEFWDSVSSNMDRDGAHIGTLRDGIVAALKDSFAADNRVFAWSGIGIGLLLIVFGRWWAERALLRLTADRIPQGRLRRSALACAVVVVATVFFGLGAKAIVTGLDWHRAFSDAEVAIANALVFAVFFGSFVEGLGRALLSAARPSWRLPPIPDRVAQRLRMFPLLLGCVAGISILQRHVYTLIGASVSAAIAGSLIVTVLYSSLIGWGLWRVGRARDEAAQVQGDDAAPEPRTAWVGVGMAVLWIGVVAALAAALIGYVALAQQIARQMVALGIVVATLYLIVHLVEDLCAAALSSRAGWAQKTFGLELRVLDQFAVLCSGLFRVAALLLVLTTAFAPLGAGPDDLVARIAQSGSGFRIGQIALTPDTVFGAILVFLLGLVVVRALQRWLLGRYLPTTRLDPGMRSSVTSLLGYVGMVVVVGFALSALGLSLERITWIASALSVGIGFGLQAVVQNFVSGLILLVERPVKVGDWVVLGDIEGDIRRINVRATEIQMADRSTMIVPNSELITKSVRNVTLANAEGRVRIRLPMPIDSDADRVRELLQEALAAHQGVLKTPAPSVLLDGIEGTSLIFVVTAYVANPRQSGSVRSDLLFEVLARMRAERITLQAPYHVKLRTPLPGSPDGNELSLDEHSG